MYTVHPFADGVEKTTYYKEERVSDKKRRKKHGREGRKTQKVQKQEWGNVKIKESQRSEREKKR